MPLLRRRAQPVCLQVAVHIVTPQPAEGLLPPLLLLLPALCPFPCVPCFSDGCLARGPAGDVGWWVMLRGPVLSVLAGVANSDPGKGRGLPREG